MLFAMALAVLLGPTVVCAGMPPANVAGSGISTHLVTWTPRPFADVVLDNPDLAACFLLAQRWWATARAPQAIPDAAALERAIGNQLGGEGQPGSPVTLTVYLAASDTNSAAAITHADTVLVLAPNEEHAGVTDLARAIATSRLLAHFESAPPDPRCSEPLLALGEAIARAGALALADLPPSLRPVNAWVDQRELAPALNALVDEALDADTPWAERKARLATLGQLGGAGPQVANAAALLVEAFGDTPRALRAPLDFLRAWREHGGKRLPAFPHDLQRALARPLEAGLPKAKKMAERAAIEVDALGRAVASGTAEFAAIGKDAPAALRLQLAANTRAEGNPGLCGWLTAAPLAISRSGCRSEGEEAGIVFARPRAGTGFDVEWRASSGDEAPLLSWPRWILYPAVNATRGELCFIDAQGLWRVPLDAHTPPRLALAGAFRQLGVSPDGGSIAVARWPGGQVVVVRDSGPTELPVNGKGGLAWLESDLLLAADGETLSLASLRGEVRAGVLPLPCCDSLATGKVDVTAGLTHPCEPSLERVVLPERRAAMLVKLAEAPLGIVILDQGDVVFGSAEGLWRWRGEGNPERIGAGLTPGPG